MPFHSQDYGRRYQALGDQAETAYERLLPHGPAVRFGWQRPPIGFGNMPDTLRYMPDYYTQTGRLVEVVGCGRDRIVRGIKLLKLDALIQWDLICPTWVWLWNSHLEQSATIPAFDLASLAEDMPTATFEHGREGAKEHYVIPWADLERWYDHAHTDTDPDAGADTRPARRTGPTPRTSRSKPAGTSGQGLPGEDAPAGP